MTTDKISEGINNALMNLEMIAAGRDTISGGTLSQCDMKRLAADAIAALQGDDHGDYEALKAAHEEELFCVRQNRDTHFGALMQALEQVDAMKAECEKLRTAMIEAKGHISHYMYGGSSYREPAVAAIELIDDALAAHSEQGGGA